MKKGDKMICEIKYRQNMFDKPDWIEDFGNYNHLPTPYKEVDIQEFWNFDSCYTPDYIEYRQVVDFPDANIYASIRIYYYYDAAFAFFWNYCGYDGKSGKYIYKPRVLRIGCKHEDEIIYQSNCYRELMCKKCGRKSFIDSSG